MTDQKPVEQPFVSTRGLAATITGLVVVQLVALALRSLDIVAPALLQASSRLALVTFIVFLMWVHRFVANLPALGSMRSRFTPAEAVVGFIIPVLSLVRGYQVMATVWKESQPPVVDDNGVALEPKATIVGWWWGLYLASILVPLVLSVVYFATGDAGAAVRGIFASVRLMHLMQIVAGVLFVVMVRATRRRQDEQWLDLERRRNVPKPTGDLLR